MNKPPRPKTVDEYISATPEWVQPKLRQLRAAIRASAPSADERISYRMPYYSHKGRLAYFAAFKNHIGLYLPTPIIEEHRAELQGFETSKATIRLPLDKKLPIPLIKKLIKARMKLNDIKRDKKQK